MRSTHRVSRHVLNEETADQLITPTREDWWDDGGVHQVYFGDDLISFERKADVHTKITLYDNKDGESTVDSQYGKMYMQTRLCHAEKCDEYWSVEYQLLSNDEVILHQKLCWEFTPIKNI